MIIKIKPNTQDYDIEMLKNYLNEFDIEWQEVKGKKACVWCLIGDTSKIDLQHLKSFNAIESVTKIQENSKCDPCENKPKTEIKVGNVTIGGDNFTVIAGPCSVESREQIISIAMECKNYGAHILRGGAFKPRTSPYSFQGLELEGLDLLLEAKKVTNMPIITEIQSVDMIPRFVKDVDIIQVGARNMQNFHLLKALGKIDKPILLKRGLSATIEEWLMSAEYILSGGNKKVILCERGIRTFETYTRNTLDLSAVLAVKELSTLPVIVDPSHSAGKWSMVEALSKASLAVGADGIIVEVHNNPDCALCDGPQSIKPKRFKNLMDDLKKIAPIIGKKL